MDSSAVSLLLVVYCASREWGLTRSLLRQVSPAPPAPPTPTATTESATLPLDSAREASETPATVMTRTASVSSTALHSTLRLCPLADRTELTAEWVPFAMPIRALLTSLHQQDFSLFNPAITDAEQNVIYNQYWFVFNLGRSSVGLWLTLIFTQQRQQLLPNPAEGGPQRPSDRQLRLQLRCPGPRRRGLPARQRQRECIY